VIHHVQSTALGPAHRARADPLLAEQQPRGGRKGAGGDLFTQAVAIVKRDRKASTSYIQRRLQIGYNRAASLMERMELEGIVGQANHAGKREILVEEEEGRF
jgi:S-DNA-T family DNA segregation ATPase FtsK/SpoIIIE